MSNRQSFFESVYRDNLWNSSESRSGHGSELANTVELRAQLPVLLRQLGVTSMLDLPCGDFNWMQHVDLSGVQYVGADIVPEVVSRNQARFGNKDRNFIQADIVQGVLPDTDLVFCRDCLIHFSLELALRALTTILASRTRYLLLTHDSSLLRYEPADGKNVDIEALENGVNYQFRPLNFTLAPFLFPPPDTLIHEGSWDGCKTMALWRTDELRRAAAAQ